MRAHLAKMLRRLRQQNHFSLQDVASRLGVHFTTVSAWERGRSEPAYDTLERLTHLYGVGPGDLLQTGLLPRPRRPFRSLSPAAAETLLQRLEEGRLAVSLATEMSRPGGSQELADRCRIAANRLAALATGEARFRPAETAALVRELGEAPQVAALDSLAVPEAGSDLDPGLLRRVETLLQAVRNYLIG
ncbi:MAG: helix-turn-helix domain-containing protein [Acidobacteriota bacterium]